MEHLTDDIKETIANLEKEIKENEPEMNRIYKGMSDADIKEMFKAD